MTIRTPIIVGDGTALIPLTRGLFATIDQTDLPIVSGRAWYAHPRSDGKGFYARSSDGLRMHRLILGLIGKALGDHRDGDGLNNRRSNLRIGDHAGNSQNARRSPLGAMRGVREIKGRFYARIRTGNTQRALGGFATREQAHAAYVAAAESLHGEWLSPDLQ